MRIPKIICLIAVSMLVAASAHADESTRKERRAIKQGVEHYKNGDLQEALDAFAEALVLSPNSETASFDYAKTLYSIGKKSEEGGDSICNEAISIYEKLANTAANKSIREKSNYNLGNIAFNNEDYAQSIEYYKKVLRSDPGNRRTRENMLVAILKLKEQQGGGSDDQQQQQEQQDQQEQQQQEQQDQQDQQQQEPDQQKEMSENAEQILQTMQNRENETREKVKAVPARTRSTDKPW